MLRMDRKRLNEIKKIYKNNNIYFALYADYLFNLGKTKKALNLIKKHLDEYPEYLTGYIVYGHILYALNQYDKTEEIMNKALKIDSKCALAYNILGDIYLEKGEKEKYLSYYGDVMRYDPFNSKLRNTVSLLKKDYCFDSDDDTQSKFYTEKELNETIDKVDDEIKKESQELNTYESEVNDFIIDNESQFVENDSQSEKTESSLDKISFDANLDDIIDEVIDKGNITEEDKKVKILKPDKSEVHYVRRSNENSMDLKGNDKNHSLKEDVNDHKKPKDISEFLMSSSISFVNELFGDEDISIEKESDDFHSDDEKISYKDIDAVLSPKDFDVIDESRRTDSSYTEEENLFDIKSNIKEHKFEKPSKNAGIEPNLSIENQDEKIEPIIDTDVVRKFSDVDLVEEERIFASAKQFSSDEEIKSIRVDNENTFKAKIVDKIIDKENHGPKRSKIKIATSTLGEIYSSQGEYQKAKETYALLLSEEPDNFDYKLNLITAEFNISKARVEEEREYYGDLVEKYPENGKYQSRFKTYDDEYKVILSNFDLKIQLLNREKTDNDRSENE